MSRMVREGFETEFESLMAKKTILADQKAEEIGKAIGEVEARFAERAKTIDDLLFMISDEISEEVPEEEVMEEVKEEGETEITAEGEENPVAGM